jgi:hypothetical protein
MEIEVSSGGKVFITKATQQQWTDDEISTAVFAGQIMYIFETEDNSSKYELDYLGFKTKNHYSSIQAAKLAAPDFARTVLEHMRLLIV